MTAATLTAAGLTVEDIARRTGRSRWTLQAVLDDLEQAGLVARDDQGRWRLTAECERRLGPALRKLEPRA